MLLLQLLDTDLLERAVLQVSTLEWLTALGIGVALAAGMIVVHKFLTWRLRKFSQHTSNMIDDLVVVVLEKTRYYFLVAVGLHIGLLMRDFPERITAVTARVLFIVFLLQLVRWGTSLISFYVKRYKERNLEADPASVTTVQAMGFIGRLILWVIVLLLALQNFGVEITPLVTGLGIGGIAVALAVQNILGDLFASLSIVLDKPFVVGDFLIVGDFLGSVESIGLKTTRLRSLSGEQLVFANSDLLNSRIRNYKRMFERRIVFSIGVTYQTPYEQLERIPGMLREIVEAQEQVRFDRAHFKGYGDFSLDFEIVYYVLAPDYNLYMDIQQAINLRIFKQFEDEGIEFAYPTQTLFMNAEKALPVRTQLVDGNGHTPHTDA